MKSIALIGTGRIGTHHARTLAKEVDGIQLVALLDPMEEATRKLADELGISRVETDPLALVDDPSIDGVVITSPSEYHVEQIEAYAAAGKQIFTEKPLGVTVEEATRALDACEKAGVILQVGFNRRFAEAWSSAEKAIADGKVGDVQMMRSVTRDPGPYGGDPAHTPLGTIFTQTLIHDFDTLNWLNSDAEPVAVHATADALIRPDAKKDGFLDTAIVTITYSNGAMATAEASFCAMYGYDLRGEVLGSEGMVRMGSPVSSGAEVFDASGLHQDTAGTDTSRYHESYRLEFQAFSDLVNGNDVTYPDGKAGLFAQLVAQAAIVSATENRIVTIEEVRA